MNEEIMKTAGFKQYVNDVKAGFCPFCKKEIDSDTEFRDKLSIKEFQISGLCQKCQDNFFEEEEKCH